MNAHGPCLHCARAAAYVATQRGVVIARFCELHVGRKPWSWTVEPLPRDPQSEDAEFSADAAVAGERQHLAATLRALGVGRPPEQPTHSLT